MGVVQASPSHWITAHACESMRRCKFEMFGAMICRIWKATHAPRALGGEVSDRPVRWILHGMPLCQDPRQRSHAVEYSLVINSPGRIALHRNT